MAIQNVVTPASVRPAIIVVMRLLPDRNRNPETVVEAALAEVPEPERPKVEPIVCRLIKLSPRCWGIHRRKRWWRIMLQCLPASEALACYLKQFPPSLTIDQRHQLKRELKRRFGLDEVAAAEKLSRFTVRKGRPRRSSNFCRCDL